MNLQKEINIIGILILVVLLTVTLVSCDMDDETETGSTDYDLTIEIEGEGTTEPEPGTHEFSDGEMVDVKAITDEGSEFVKWDGNVQEYEEQETSILIESDETITAVFKEYRPEPAKIEVSGRSLIYVARERGEQEKYSYQAEVLDQNLNIIKDENVNWKIEKNNMTGVKFEELENNELELTVSWDSITEDFTIKAVSDNDSSISAEKNIEMDYLSEREENVYKNAFDNLDDNIEKLNLDNLTENIELPTTIDGYDSEIDENISFKVLWSADDHDAITIDNGSAIIDRGTEDVTDFINAFIQPEAGESLGLAAGDPRQKDYQAIVKREEPELEEVDVNRNLNVDYGTSEEEILNRLENDVRGTLNDGETVDLYIDWRPDPSYNPESPGHYSFEGDLSRDVGEDSSFEIPDELSTITATVTVNEEDLIIEENKDTVIEEVITENEEALTSTSLNVKFEDDEKERSFNMQFDELPDAVLYRTKGNEWFKYARVEEVGEGEVEAMFDSSEVEVLPIRVKEEVKKTGKNTLTMSALEKPFNIIEIDGGSIEVEVGGLEEIQGKDPWRYVIAETTEKGNKESDIDDKLEDDGDINYFYNDKILQSNLSNGRHTIYILAEPFDLPGSRITKPRIIWEQDVFINYFSLNQDKDKLAEKYAPILFFNSDEDYFPKSLEGEKSIFGDLEVDNHFRFEAPNPSTFRRYEISINFEDTAENKMKNHGHRRGEFKYATSWGSIDFSEFEDRRGSIEKITIYYSLLERGNNYYLNYHMLYAFDPKSELAGSMGQVAEHILDRESATIVLNNDLEPEKIVYGAHLDDQNMGIENKEDDYSWIGGGVSLDWNEVLKVGDHPVLSIAEGAHAVYPVPEIYFYHGREDSFRFNEPAGDWSEYSQSKWNENIAYPSSYRGLAGTNSADYDLKNLLYEYRSGSSSSIFSGFFNINWIPLNNIKFPPFTIREVNPERYVKKASTEWTDEGATGEDFDFKMSMNSLEEYSYEILSDHILPKFHKAKESNNYLSDEFTTESAESLDGDLISMDSNEDKPEVTFTWESPMLDNGARINSLPDGYLIERKENNSGDDFRQVGRITKVYDSENECIGYVISDDINNLCYSDIIEVDSEGRLVEEAFGFLDRAELENGKEYVYSVRPFTKIEGLNGYGEIGRGDYLLSREAEELGPYMAEVDSDEPDYESKYTGQVLLEGENPGREIEVSVIGDINENITTDTDGQFVVSTEDGIEPGDEIMIRVGSSNNYSTTEIESKNLNAWVTIRNFEVEEGKWELPVIDLYSYDMELVKPEFEEEVGLPYQVEINEYEKNIEDLIYWLYFVDFEGEYLGDSEEVFSDETFGFTGNLEGGGNLTDDAYWYLAGAYQIDKGKSTDYIVEVNSFGTFVYLEGTEDYQVIQGIDKIQDHRSKRQLHQY